eukprot:SAG31_NODE_3515_length_4170_cov_7.908131_4_plen_151_part_00
MCSVGLSRNPPFRRRCRRRRRPSGRPQLLPTPQRLQHPLWRSQFPTLSAALPPRWQRGAVPDLDYRLHRRRTCSQTRHPHRPFPTVNTNNAPVFNLQHAHSRTIAMLPSAAAGTDESELNPWRACVRPRAGGEPTSPPAVATAWGRSQPM